MSSSSRSAGGGPDGESGAPRSAAVGDATLPESAGVGLAATLASGGVVIPATAVVTSAAFPVPNWDRYEFISTLGRGGMGSVYKARDRRLGRIVALKFIHGDDPGLTSRFLQEARAQARLTSPHICKIHEAGFVDHKPYIAMELVDGASLDRAGQALSLVEKVQVIRDVAQAMHLAHEEGIIHRDLKPSNIMLERLGGGRLRPVVMDFGLARDRDASASHGLTESGAVIGTPAYMSPEQARGEARRLDRRSDVYSLGATLYDLLSGKPPFQDETVVNLLLKVVNEPPTPLRSRLPDVPDALDLIVSKCLNKEPEQRYPSARALAEDLDRYLHAERVVARRLGYGYRLRYFARRNRAMTGLAAALISAAIALLVVGIRGRLLSLRQAREAREQAALAQTLGQSVKDLEWLVRTAYLLPLHDSSYEKGIVRARMARITAELATAGEHGVRLGAYVLGRGHLALHEWDLAHTQLKRAQDLGYRDAGLDYALGRVLGEKYSRALDEARKSGDKSFVEGRKKELETEFLIPARQHLQRSRGLTDESPNFVGALLDFYNEHYDAALLNAQMARKQAPWLYETLKLEGDVHMVRALAQRDHGDNDTADKSFALAVARYEEAAGIAHSDPQVHEALAEAWIRQEEMDLYRGVDPTPKMEKALAAAERAIEASPHTASGYIKQAFSYVFAAQHALHSANLDLAFRRCQAQATAAKSAIRRAPDDAFSYDIHGLAYRCITEISINRQADHSDAYTQAKWSFEKSITLYPQFPWALNDLAGLYTLAAQHATSLNKNPQQYTSAIYELTEKAIKIDKNYVITHQNSLAALGFDVAWSSEQGINPEELLQRAQSIASQIIAIQPNNPLTYWNLALIYHHALQYYADKKISAQRLITDALTQSAKTKELLHEMPDSYALAAQIAALSLDCGTASGLTVGAIVSQGAQALATCHALAVGNPECQVSTVALGSAQIAANGTGVIQSKIDHILDLITKIVENKSPSSEHSMICANAALRLASNSELTNQTKKKLATAGIICAESLLAKSSVWPRANAIRGALSIILAKLSKTTFQTQKAAIQASNDFNVAFAGNPILRARFGGFAEEAEQMKTGL